jgi:hypothetical protein
MDTADRICRRPRGGARRLIVAFVLLPLWLVTFAISASPQLHLLLHSDASSPSHNCVVTQLQQHSVLGGSEPIGIPVPALAVCSGPGFSSVISLASIDLRLSPGRAPPVSLPS